MRALLCLLCLLPATAFPESLSRGERDRAMSELHATRKQFLDAIAGLSAAQWNFKPSDTAWSIAETAEHIAVSEDFLFELVTKKVMASPAQPEKKEEVKGKDETVLTLIRDRSTKAKAPETLLPKRRWATPQEVADHFGQSRNRTITYIETTPGDVRAHFARHPAAGLLDAYQWVLLISAHSARHVVQIEEIKADPRFPKP
ncbi:MAG TPA: DinB family protein [Bryobacteraceae bacterium]|nr:DinB family protein [Bryobacteraceae bacterium]